MDTDCGQRCTAADHYEWPLHQVSGAGRCRSAGCVCAVCHHGLSAAGLYGADSAARAVSRYFHVKSNSSKQRLKRYRNSTFEEYVRNDNNEFFLDTDRFLNSFIGQRVHLKKIMDKYSPFENQLDWIVDENGEVLIDFVGRFENLTSDFETICEKIGIPSISLKHINKSKHKHYTEYYNKETRKIIAEKYCRDIEYFGYKFK